MNEWMNKWMYYVLTIAGELFSNIHVNTNDLDVIPTIFIQSRVETDVYTNYGILLFTCLIFD
jgi:hypothetical protein